MLQNATMSQFCSDALGNSLANIILGAVLTVGAFATYIPQHVSILRSKSVEGMSWLWLLLGNMSSLASLLTSVALQVPTLECCSSVAVPFWSCQELLLPVYQIAVPFVNYYPIWIMYLVFSRSADSPPPDVSKLPRALRWCKCLGWKRWPMASFVLFSLVQLLACGLLLSALLTWVGPSSAEVKAFAIFFGVLASVCTTLMYIPQMVTTFRAKDPGALSMLMLALQAPGSLATVYFQAIGSGQPLTTWGAYLVSAAMQIALCTLGTYYRVRQKIRSSKAYAEDESGPLLQVDEIDVGGLDSNWSGSQTYS